MIARQLLDELAYSTVPERTGSRAGRNATERRRGYAAAVRYAAIVRVLIVVAVVTVCVMAYLMLLARATQLNYELVRVNHEQRALRSQTRRLDDQLANLKSRDRLAKIAAQLGLVEPRTFIVLDMPPPHVADRRSPGLAFLSSVTGWLK
ncbi:MAG: hypothetical protein ACREM6_10060 [Vulcanimicrobiaceae bacterium]